MIDFLKTLFSLSISGSLLILILLVCKPLIQSKLSRQWQYYIWLVVVARLLLPFTLQISLSGMFLQSFKLEAEQTSSSVSDNTGLPFMNSSEQTAGYTASDSPSQTTTALTDNDKEHFTRQRWKFYMMGNTQISAWFCLGFLWITVTMFLLIRKITIYQYFSRYTLSGCTEVSDPLLLDELCRTAASVGVTRPVELFTNSLVSSPLLLGFFRPCIVLPTTALHKQDFHYILLHELVHYKRHDMIYKWLIQFTICLHWFNPLVWLMGRETCRACELACDEAVIQRLDSQQRRSYGDTLLRAAGTGRTLTPSLVSITLNESAKLLKERLAAIMKYHKSTKSVSILSVLFTIVLLLGATAAGAYTASAKSTSDRQPPSDTRSIKQQFPVIQPETKNDTQGFGTSQTNTADESNNYGAGKNNPYIYMNAEGQITSYFRVQWYYQAPYLFKIGWNVKADSDDAYPSQSVVLPDKTSITVSFCDDCISILENTAAFQALTTLLPRMVADAPDIFPVSHPLILSFQNMGNSSPEALAEYYLVEDDLEKFAAVLDVLDENMHRFYLEKAVQKAYDTRDIAAMSICLSFTNDDRSIPARYAEKAYNDNNITFFSVLIDYMEPDAQRLLYDKAVQDKNIVFQSILLTAMDEEEQQISTKQDLETSRLEEYQTYGITKSDAGYYYNGTRIGTLLDLRPDNSFITLHTDPLGEVNIKILRDEDGTINQICSIPVEEMAELFGAEYSEAELFSNNNVINLSADGLPDSVQAANQCEIRKWYLIHTENRQYLYYKGFAWSFAYTPVLQDDGWHVEIVKMHKKSHGDLILSFPEGACVQAVCDGEPVLLTELTSNMK